ncbi:Gfo/Idh/MocA family protein [Pararobbsia silviterrae]|uniref:Gfo/Idh/MocA family oxidoreductase n=1 Tax=Pararobbsia silviterrae TaxID=1792498 RepID=A0A494XG66_9BURK|nr:Gfo/Idh/MocA family oxidoreductase [Pararobbsia silviterrae]RKP49650.1 gfo/Idh/MocA family oxidoreductase [Pararobbsia silviterrae]
MSAVRIGLIGAGAIGRAHLVGAAAAPGVDIVGIADPSPAAHDLAHEFSIPWFPDHQALLDRQDIGGAIVATPNALHVPIAMDLIARGKAVLIEKPIADSIEEGLTLARAADDANVPLLVGHHRRHNPIVRQARRLVKEGKLGRLVSASVLATFLKHDAYFNEAWRRSKAAGPVLINLIHEIDVLRFVCGEIESIQALTSNAVRGFDVEDTAVVLLRLKGGTLATITLSDTAAAPWSWDLTSAENPAFPTSSAESHFLCGTDASIALPTLRMWRYPGERGWHHAMESETVPVARANPYIEQMRHFAAVIRGDETPLIDGFDATKTLQATLAVRESAESGVCVTLTDRVSPQSSDRSTPNALGFSGGSS